MANVNSKTKLRTKVSLGVLAGLIVMLVVILWANRAYFFSHADTISAIADNNLSNLTLNPARDVTAGWLAHPAAQLLDENEPNISDYIVSAGGAAEEILAFNQVAGVGTVKSVQVAFYAKRQDQSSTQLATDLKIGDWQKGTV